METDSVKETILAYEEQLLHIEAALLSTTNDVEKDTLLSLKSDIQQLLDLTRETCLIDHEKESPEVTTSLNDEYAQFMLEMQKEGAIEESNTNKNNLVNTTLFGKSLKELEGTKCKAPHKHNWGETVYHNAMICTVLQPNKDDDIEVKVMFINPTDQEMLPCPYFLETDCKFPEEQCRFSHGETVLLSSLREYVEPNFESIIIGSKVLAKRYNKLWHRASVTRLLNQKCIVKFESNTEEVELNFHDILPLDSDNTETVCEIESEEESNYEDIVNMSLVITPASQALGEWEKFTKGIGSKLMAKMGYITGSGLGKKADGILEPVSAVVLPVGKSLDYCMNLRENFGDDKDLFNAEKRMKKFKKKREMLNQKAYEREKKKVDVFNFLNDALMTTEKEDISSISKFKHRQEIKKETSRDLNVASLKIEENIKGIERELFKIRESLSRHSDKKSQLYKSLILQQNKKQCDLKSLKDQAINIRNEQNIRRDKRKLTIF